VNEPAAPASAEASPALRATRLRKRYHVVPRLRALLRDGSHDHGGGSVTALDEVSFEVASGGALAVIGANGAGKSTLLRILAGLSLPSSGAVETHARIGTLLELGAGLVEEWSGEVNARSALTLQGLPAERLAAIERFAEIGAFFERPVRTYSTGMRLRLAYALAMGLSPELLIADEVVAVGDEGFQLRCSRELERFLVDGGTLVLATHNLYLADKICQRALWLDHGRVRALGPVREVTAAYRDAIHARDSSAPGRPAVNRRGSSPRLAAHAGDRLEVVVRGASAQEGPAHAVVEAGEPWSITVTGKAVGRAVRLCLRRADGTLIASFPAEDGRLGFPTCDLLPGRFVAELCVASPGDEQAVLAGASFVVRGAGRELGSVRLEHEWL